MNEDRLEEPGKNRWTEFRKICRRCKHGKLTKGGRRHGWVSLRHGPLGPIAKIVVADVEIRHNVLSDRTELLKRIQLHEPPVGVVVDNSNNSL